MMLYLYMSLLFIIFSKNGPEVLYESKVAGEACAIVLFANLVLSALELIINHCLRPGSLSNRCHPDCPTFI